MSSKLNIYHSDSESESVYSDSETDTETDVTDIDTETETDVTDIETDTDTEAEQPQIMIKNSSVVIMNN